MIKYKIICDKYIRFKIGNDSKTVGINEFIIKVNDVFKEYCYDERIINNHYVYICQYYNVSDLLMLLDYNKGLYNIEDEYILFTDNESLNSYNIHSLIIKLLDIYYDIVLEALGYDV